jgi:hypothetical protein
VDFKPFWISIWQRNIPHLRYLKWMFSIFLSLSIKLSSSVCSP